MSPLRLQPCLAPVRLLCPPARLEVSGINDGDLPLIESSNIGRGVGGGDGRGGRVLAVG